jgi:hypothetical protein
MLSSGLPDRDDGAIASTGGAIGHADASQPADDAVPIEPPGLRGPALVVGCSDETREGFRDYVLWPKIAGCAGGFALPGVGPDLKSVCGLQAGDSSANPSGIGCSAADLCAAGWHVCRDGVDVAASSPTKSCEGCVPAGEPRFFLVASGASSMGVCTPDRDGTNDLHGCGGLGEPESPDCAPLERRMGFADCLATSNVWRCGGVSDSLQEASVVTKIGASMGGVLCCRDH